MFAAYHARLARLRRSSQTEKNFLMAAVALQSWLDTAGIDPADVPGWALEEYFAALALAVATKKLHLRCIRGAYRYALRRGLVDRDPTLDVEIERVPDTEPRILSPTELREVRDGCRTKAHSLLFHLFAYAGLRRVEARTLTWDQVNLKKATMTVMGKGSKLRKVPIHPMLGEELHTCRQVLYQPVLRTHWGKPATDSTVQAWIEQIRGGTDARGHDFRRTVASSLYRNGVPTDTIDKIMGWAPRAVRSRYYVNIADDQLQQAILRLYADDPV